MLYMNSFTESSQQPDKDSCDVHFSDKEPEAEKGHQSAVGPTEREAESWGLQPGSSWAPARTPLTTKLSHLSIKATQGGRSAGHKGRSPLSLWTYRKAKLNFGWDYSWERMSKRREETLEHPVWTLAKEAGAWGGNA